MIALSAFCFVLAGLVLGVLIMYLRTLRNVSALRESLASAQHSIAALRRERNLHRIEAYEARLAAQWSARQLAQLRAVNGANQ